VPGQDPPPPARGAADLYRHVTHPSAAGKARKWLLAIAILTALSGLVLFLVQQSEVDTAIASLDAQTSSMTPEDRDAALRESTGMSYQEIVDHDRGMVRLLLVVNLVLAVFYLGMWWWAKRNVLAASVIALLMCISMIAVSGVIEPSSLYKGLLLKVLFIAALVKSNQLALAERARAS
jgi:hypothetical protein